MNDSKYDLLFSVEAVNQLVVEGMPFREAYQKVGKMIQDGEFDGSSRTINHNHLGSIGNLGLAQIQEQKNIVWNKFGFDKVEKAMMKYEVLGNR